MSINREKIALLIPRLASNFDGEVLATVLAIRRLLKASGNDLHDLARLVDAAQNQEKPQQEKPRQENPWEQKKRARPTDVIELVELLLCCPGLTDWEREFLESIHDQATRKYWFEPSEKQQKILDRIARQRGGF
jgi:hypothetical protein